MLWVIFSFISSLSCNLGNRVISLLATSALVYNSRQGVSFENVRVSNKNMSLSEQHKSIICVPPYKESIRRICEQKEGGVVLFIYFTLTESSLFTCTGIVRLPFRVLNNHEPAPSLMDTCCTVLPSTPSGQEILHGLCAGSCRGPFVSIAVANQKPQLLEN